MIHQPLKRGWNPTHTRPAPHVMEGYAYTNPLAGLTIPFVWDSCYWLLFEETHSKAHSMVVEASSNVSRRTARTVLSKSASIGVRGRETRR